MNFNSTSKILTLQFGHYSNFVGTHWWNLQEKSFQYSPDANQDINHDVLFRDGINDKVEIFNISTLSVDCMFDSFVGSRNIHTSSIISRFER